jgi:hypothetical protein
MRPISKDLIWPWMFIGQGRRGIVHCGWQRTLHPQVSTVVDALIEDPVAWGLSAVMFPVRNELRRSVKGPVHGMVRPQVRLAGEYVKRAVSQAIFPNVLVDFGWSWAMNQHAHPLRWFTDGVSEAVVERLGD